MARPKRKLRVIAESTSNTQTGQNKEQVLEKIDSLRSNVKKRQKTEPKTSRQSYNYPLIGGVVIIIGIFGILLLSQGVGSNLIPGLNTAPNVNTYESICLTDAEVDIHYHPYLHINFNGVPQTIPANIGLTSSCMHPIHTHDTSGEIHVESAKKFNLPPATLSDFFQIWGQALSTTKVWQFSGNVAMTVDGIQFTGSGGFGSLELKDGQQIVINITS
ncbi:MAG: hypothetical protein ACFFD1_06685 [Candidatus Thorarchaeota archaeon]